MKTPNSKPPLHTLPKSELIRLASTYCPHGHTFLEHYACYDPKGERIGFLDIETSHLSADIGIILSYCILDGSTGEIIEDVFRADDIRREALGKEDRRVVRSLVKNMMKFDRIVGYYSKYFDLPFIRTRALIVGVPFPSYGAINHTDLYFLIKTKFRLSKNRLESACRTLLGKTEKTRVNHEYWRNGVRGDKKALEYILDHNRRDVKDLRDLWHTVMAFGRNTKTSI